MTSTNSSWSERFSGRSISNGDSDSLEMALANNDDTLDFSFNKLRFSSLGLYGREKELGLLTKCLERCCSSSRTTTTTADDEQEGGTTSLADDNNKSELVWIRGPSGVGKTALAQSVRKQCYNNNTRPRQKGDPIFASGKFDYHLRDEPYSGLAAACSGLVGEILTLRDNNDDDDDTIALFEEIRDAIITELDEELEVLSQILPTLQQITGKTLSPTSGSSGGDIIEDRSSHQGFAEAKYRFKYAFRRFIRALGPFFAPMVLLIDDLQYADSASLDLLENLFSTDCHNIMLIGCYRSNEVDKDHILTETIDDLREQGNDQSGFNITEISLGNLDVPEVRRLLMDLLSATNDNHLLGLAEICQRRTNGNAFFLKQFLNMLHERLLLEFNMETMEWVWDETEIENRTHATDNVVDLMKESMDNLPGNVCQILRLAACLGSTFDEKTLSLVCREYQKCYPADVGVAENPGPFDERLALVIENGFIAKKEKQGDLMWVHDKIHEAAFSLIPDQDMDSVRSRVGEILVSNLTQVELDVAIFVVVNLLNEGWISKTARPRRPTHSRLAELNLHAAKKAMKMTAMESAAKYAEKGIGSLPATRWNTHYELALDLYSTAAEAEHSIGSYEAAKSHCDEVISQGDCPLQDKLRAYNVLIQKLYADGRIRDAIQLCLDVLKQLGCRFPGTTAGKAVGSLAGIIRIKRTVKSRTLEEVEDMPMMSDPVKFEAMLIMEKLITFCYWIKDPLILPVVLRCYKWTLKYGWCEIAPATFATIGLMLCGTLFDFNSGRIFAEYALKLLDKVQLKWIKPRVYMIVYGGVLHWTQPIHGMMKPLLEGYELGLQSGDNLKAFHNLNLYLQVAMVAGRPLEAIEMDCRRHIRHMKELKQDMLAKFSSCLWQMVLNLMGRSENTTELTGEVMVEEENQDFDNPLLQVLFQAYKSQLYAWFGEYERGAELAISKGDSLVKGSPGSCLCAVDLFFRGISLFHMARKTRKRKYMQHSKRVLAKLKSWVAKGNPNLRHHEAVLEAEMAALRGMKNNARKYYEAAIALSVRQGFIQDGAMANERYGEFLLHDVGDRQEAAHHFEQAMKLFNEWGAHAKTDILLKKYADLRSVSSI